MEYKRAVFPVYLSFHHLIYLFIQPVFRFLDSSLDRLFRSFTPSFSLSKISLNHYIRFKMQFSSIVAVAAALFVGSR